MTIETSKNDYLTYVIYELDNVKCYCHRSKAEMIDFNNYLNDRFTTDNIQAVINSVYIAKIGKIKNYPELSKFPDIPAKYKHNKYKELDTIGLLVTAEYFEYK